MGSSFQSMTSLLMAIKWCQRLIDDTWMALNLNKERRTPKLTFRKLGKAPKDPWRAFTIYNYVTSLVYKLYSPYLQKRLRSRSCVTPLKVSNHIIHRVHFDLSTFCISIPFVVSHAKCPNLLRKNWQTIAGPVTQSLYKDFHLTIYRPKLHAKL